MLCDSVGIEPRPNNGTLRLPLKPVGVHEPEDRPDEPQDPVPADQEERPQEEPVKSVHPPDEASGGLDEGGDEEENQGIWGWVKDKASSLWSKLTGGS